MREHKDRCVVRRIGPPPAFPLITLPRSAHRPEHVAAQDPRAKVLERLRGHLVVRAARAAASALHFCEDFCAPKPVVQLKAANSERIVQVLCWPGAKAIDGNGKCSNTYFAHE